MQWKEGVLILIQVFPCSLQPKTTQMLLDPANAQGMESETR